MNFKQIKDEELDNISNEIIIIKKQRIIDFFNAIKSNNLNEVKSLIELGVDCSQPYFFNGFSGVTVTNSLEVLDFLLENSISDKRLDKKEISNVNNSTNSKINNSNSKTYGELFKEILTDKIISGLHYSDITNDFFKKYIKIIKDKKEINIILEKLVKKLDLNNFPDIYSYLDENNKMYLIEKTLNYKTVRMMIEKEKAPLVGYTNFKTRPDYAKIMQNGIKNANLKVIEELKSNNIAIYDKSYNKEIYSDLFLKGNKDFKDCQMYVLKNIEDVNIHNNIILRCMFHVYEKDYCEFERQKDLVSEIIISTPKESLADLEKSINERKQSKLKSFTLEAIELKSKYNVKKKVV